MCHACYGQSKSRGTLEGAMKAKPSVDGSKGRCSYEHCHRSEHRCWFVQVKEGMAARGQDCSSLAGRVLCEACYNQFSRIGTLKEGVEKGPGLVGRVLCNATANACHAQFSRSGTLERFERRLDASERRCSYEGCDRPDESYYFLNIREGKKVGGQEWGSLVGSVMCKACYMRYWDKGTLDRKGAPAIKRQAHPYRTSH